MGYALNIAIGLQVVLGSLVTALSVVVKGSQASFFLGGLVREDLFRAIFVGVRDDCGPRWHVDCCSVLPRTNERFERTPVVNHAS